jgi:hypothetical protein
MTADGVPVPGQTVVCECGEPYEQAGRGNGGWFHYMVVSAFRRPDGRTRIKGHWHAGDWIDGAPLVLRTRDGHRVAVVGAEMEPPLNRACELRGQRTLIVPEFRPEFSPEFSPFELRGCIHASR